MRTFFIFAVIACTFSHTREKPLRVIDGQRRDSGEAEYENNNEHTADDEYGQDDHEALIDDQAEKANEQRDAIQGERAVELNSYKHRPSNLQPAGLDNLDNFSELSGSGRDVRNDKTTSTNIDSNQQPILRYRQSDTYPGNNDQEATHHLSESNFKVNQDQRLGYDNNINKRAMLSLNANEEGDLLFENQKEQENKLDKGEFARENTDSNMHSPYSKFYTVPSDNREFPEHKKYEKLRLNINRDRREVEENANLKETNEPTLSPEENEESAIKRHIKKLSEQELEELFNTLSEDKRNLLKKIIENDYYYDSEAKNKREITKKAGAVEENSYMENGQLDSIKNQGVSSNVEEINTESSISQETTENSKRTMSSAELGDVGSSSKTGEKSENKAELVNQNEEIKETKSESNLDLDSKKSDTEIDSVSNSQTEEVKTENKRAANESEIASVLKTPDDTKSTENDLNPKENKGSENNQEMISDDSEPSEIINEDTEQHIPNKKTIKREVYFEESPNFSDTIKSLEESFPNSNAYDDESNMFLENEMAPLARVKRRNAESAMVKRAANVIANSNIPYFPNKGENDDEDNDEGNEFDDDGFYDRPSNYARNNVEKTFESNNPKAEGGIVKQKSGHYYNNERNNLDSDTMRLGSDTDNVMTGVEGVNENLMYSSGSRHRRALQEIDNVNNSSEDRLIDVANERWRKSTPSDESDAVTAAPENLMNVPGYQETDAFGPLPRNYDGDLGRYKRIRRVKQTPVLMENAS